MTRFRFTLYHHPSLGVIRYPLIPVRLLGPARSVRQAMLLDSGADITMLPARLAEHLGFSLSTEPTGELQGIAGVLLPYVAGEIDIEIGTCRFHVRLAWAFADNAPAVLGRLDLFRQADISFRESADAIVFTPSPSSSC